MVALYREWGGRLVWWRQGFISEGRCGGAGIGGRCGESGVHAEAVCNFFNFCHNYILMGFGVKKIQYFSQHFC